MTGAASTSSEGQLARNAALATLQAELGTAEKIAEAATAAQTGDGRGRAIRPTKLERRRTLKRPRPGAGGGEEGRDEGEPDLQTAANENASAQR